MARTTTALPAVRAVVTGAVAGVAASLAMAMYAMIASATYQHHGFFTPLYHIASTFVAPTALTISMGDAMAGSTFYFTFGVAVLGAIVHMMVGAMYGALFAIGVQQPRLRGTAVLAGAGLLWGTIVFVISSWALLPVTAKVFDSGDQITHMAKMVGYPTFPAEHLIFGLVLGLIVATRRAADDR
jgi:signal transduction histidine kinase